MKLTSPSFNYGDPLPDRFARDDDNLSPPLSFFDIPPEAKSLALVIDDPDAPGGTFTHWIVYNLEPSVLSIPEDRLPPSTLEGMNDFGEPGYGGPRPPSGTHRYCFHAYALDCVLDLPAGASRRQFDEAIEQHVIENAELMGRYSAVPAEVP